MQKLPTVRRIAVFGALAAAAMLFSAGDRAQARPTYLKQFMVKYEALAAQARQAKCNVCHYGKSKKNRNDWGQAIMNHIGEKNQRDVEKIIEALTNAEKEQKPGTEMTFGDLLKAGKLPGSEPAE